MTNKERYEALCQQEEMPLFMQYWWLEGVCAGKDWDVLLVEEDDQIVAAMPYETYKFLWRRNIQQQEMSPYGGVWLAESVKQDAHKLEDVCKRLDAQLAEKKIRSYNQRFDVGSFVPSRLTKLGFKSVERRTYVLENVQNLDDVLDAFSRNKRKKLEKHTLTYKVEQLDPEVFYRFHVATCAQKKKKIWYTREMLLVLWEKTQLRGQSAMFGVFDANKELLAAAFLVWDKTTAYLLLNTFDHDYPDNGARELLTLEAIKRTRELGLMLDFTYHRDYLKHYGAKRRAYWSVYKGPVAHTWVNRMFEKLHITFGS